MPAYSGTDRELAAVIKSFKLDFDLFNSCSENEISQLKLLQESVNASELEYEKGQDMKTLEKMVKLRFEMARAVGYKNPLEIVLRDKQLNSSEAVLLFLKSAEDAGSLNQQQLLILVDLLLIAYSMAESQFDPEATFKAEDFFEDMMRNWGKFLRDLLKTWSDYESK